jgi:hypothetical protein
MLILAYDCIFGRCQNLSPCDINREAQTESFAIKEMEPTKFNPRFIYEGSISGKIRVAIKAAPPESTKIASRHRTNK